MFCWIVSRGPQARLFGSSRGPGGHTEAEKLRQRETRRTRGLGVRAAHPGCQNPNLTLRLGAGGSRPELDLPDAGLPIDFGPHFQDGG